MNPHTDELASIAAEQQAEEFRTRPSLLAHMTTQVSSRLTVVSAQRDALKAALEVAVEVLDRTRPVMDEKTSAAILDVVTRCRKVLGMVKV